jgi:hypothetical protein
MGSVEIGSGLIGDVRGGCDAWRSRARGLD